MCSIHFTNRSILFQAMFLHTDYTSRVHTWHNVSFITYFYKFGFFYTALYITSLDNINIKNLPEEFQAFFYQNLLALDKGTKIDKTSLN